MGVDADRARRGFLRASAVLGAGIIAAWCAPQIGAAEQSERVKKADKPGSQEDVSPAEDLMREHGVLKRVLLVYGEGIRRLDANRELSLDAITDAAKIIRTFIEDYHEKLEEEHLFPRFRKAGVQVELVDTLMAQHQAGGRVTDQTMQLVTRQAIGEPDDRRRLADSLRAFIRMYEPHEAREDTVLFPALHKIVTPHEYDALGEEFEKIEHQKFGEGGFEQMVERVATIEKNLGIYDLAQFTPNA